MVVTLGVTTVLPVVATGVPLRRTWEALAVDHCRVLLAPLMIVVGLAVKEVIVGQLATVTVVERLAVWPAQSLLVTVMV